MSTQVKVMAILAARPGKAGQLRALLDGVVAASRLEAGNLSYDFWQDQADPSRFVLDELYMDDEAAAAHRATPHFQTYLAVVNELAERMSASLNPVAVRRSNRKDALI